MSTIKKFNIDLPEEGKHLCAGAGCMNEATLVCPSCDVHPGLYHFCSQDCFKINWKTHKLLHASVSGSSDISYQPFSGYLYTGTLRKYPVSPQVSVSREEHPGIVHPDYHQTGVPESEEKSYGSATIKVNTPDEIKKMRKVCRLGRQILDTVARHIRPGITTDALDKIVHAKALELNCYPSPLNYRCFPKSVCTSVNEVVCHGIPDMRPLRDGDILNIDVTVYHNGFHGDLNETFPVGTVDEKGLRLIEKTRECLYKAIDIVRPGVHYKELGNVINKIAQSAGLTINRNYCGHGVNDLFHCAPTVPHYAHNNAKGIMRAGHTFTIEPMICEGSHHDAHWPDEWTCVTKDGKRSAQFEHTLLVTDHGCEVLTEKY